jgi:hypothetical protein
MAAERGSAAQRLDLFHLVEVEILRLSTLSEERLKKR